MESRLLQAGKTLDIPCKRVFERRQNLIKYSRLLYGCILCTNRVVVGGHPKTPNIVKYLFELQTKDVWKRCQTWQAGRNWAIALSNIAWRLSNCNRCGYWDKQLEATFENKQWKKVKRCMREMSTLTGKQKLCWCTEDVYHQCEINVEFHHHGKFVL